MMWDGVPKMGGIPGMGMAWSRILGTGSGSGQGDAWGDAKDGVMPRMG